MNNFVSADAAIFRGTWADYVSADMEERARAREWAELEVYEGDFCGSQESEIDRGGDPVGFRFPIDGVYDDIPF